MEGIKNGIRALFDALDFSRSQAGLATFNAKVDFLVPMGRDREGLKAAVESFYPRTGSRVDLAMRAGKDSGPGTRARWPTSWPRRPQRTAFLPSNST